jgi:hypothetical protein
MDDTPAFRPPGAFVKHLIECSDISRRRPVESTDDWERYDLDLSHLKLGAGFFVPFVILKSLARYESITADQLAAAVSALGEITRTVRHEFVVWVVGGRVRALPQQIRAIGEDHDIAVIDRPIIDAVYAADSQPMKQRALAAGLVRSLGRLRLSPYTPGDVAYGGRFFGRKTLVNKALTAHRSNGLTLVGNRRMGKTSLLREIKHQLANKNERLKIADLYGSKYHSTASVVDELLRQLRPELTLRIERGDAQLVKEFPLLIHQLSDKEDVTVAVFIDEVDELLALDQLQDHELMNLLRAAFQHEGCRAFFAGFRRAIEAKQRNDSPMFNFTKSEVVGAFTREETTAMIVEPLALLDLDVASTDLPAMIYRETAGHPELIQIFCGELITQAEASGSVPSAAGLLSDVLDSEVFRQRVLGAFLANTNSYEQLLCYTLFLEVAEKHLNYDQFEFGISDIGRLLEAQGLSTSVPELTGLASNLKIAGVFEEVRSAMRYRLAVPQLGTYCKMLELPYCVQRAKEQLRKERVGIWAEPDTRRNRQMPL